MPQTHLPRITFLCWVGLASLESGEPLDAAAARVGRGASSTAFLAISPRRRKTALCTVSAPKLNHTLLPKSPTQLWRRGLKSGSQPEPAIAGRRAPVAFLAISPGDEPARCCKATNLNHTLMCNFEGPKLTHSEFNVRRTEGDTHITDICRTTPENCSRSQTVSHLTESSKLFKICEPGHVVSKQFDTRRWIAGWAQIHNSPEPSGTRSFPGSEGPKLTQAEFNVW